MSLSANWKAFWRGFWKGLTLQWIVIDHDGTIRKDAERWRWLANDCDGNAQDDFIIWLGGHVGSKEDLDAAIDAAMQENP